MNFLQNAIRAVAAGLLVFVIQVGVASVVNNVAVPLLSLLNAGTWLAYTWQVVMGLVLAAIVYFVARWYFNRVGSIVHGFYLGVTMVVVNLVLVVLQALPALAYGQNITGDLLGYLASLAFWLTSGITIVAAMAAGYMKRNNMHWDVKAAVRTCMPNDAGNQAGACNPFEAQQ